MTKTLLKQGQNSGFEAVLEMSVSAQAIAHQTEDHMEGLDAVLEKRPGRFKGS
jgi:enoyl-CoA hydratase/carnithine racemase